MDESDTEEHKRQKENTRRKDRLPFLKGKSTFLCNNDKLQKRNNNSKY